MLSFQSFNKMHDVTLTPAKLIIIIATSIVGSAVATLFAAIRISTSDHYLLKSLDVRVEAVENGGLSRIEHATLERLLDEKFSNIAGKFISIEDKFSGMEKRLDRIELKIDSLR